MFSRKTILTAALLFPLMTGCSNHPASDSVKAFTMAMADSAWSRGWNMLTPATRAAWDSTAAVMQRFGYQESSHYLSTLSAPVTAGEFLEMDGEMLFTRMAQSSPEITRLSDTVRDVELMDSLTALVTVATVDGDQVIPVRLVEGNWLLDLTSLTPPAPEPE